MENKKMVLVLSMLMLVVILFGSFVSAGPYGYGDSMDLKKKIDNGKITYGYGEKNKYETSLKPKDVNWSEWKKTNIESSRRKVINKSWDEINGVNNKVKKTEVNKSKVENMGINQVSQKQPTFLNKIMNFIGGLF